MKTQNIEFKLALCRDCTLGKQYVDNRLQGSKDTADRVRDVLSSELSHFKVNENHLSEKAINVLAAKLSESLVDKTISDEQRKSCYEQCFAQTGCIKQKAQRVGQESKVLKNKMLSMQVDTSLLLTEIQGLVDIIIELSVDLDTENVPDDDLDDTIFRSRILDRILIDIIAEATSEFNPGKKVDFLTDIIPRPFLETFLSVMKELLGNDFIKTLKLEIEKALHESSEGKGLTKEAWHEFQDTQVFKDIVAALQIQLVQQAKKESFQAWCHNKLSMVDDVNILILKRVLETLGKNDQVQLF